MSPLSHTIGLAKVHRTVAEENVDETSSGVRRHKTAADPSFPCTPDVREPTYRVRWQTLEDAHRPPRVASARQLQHTAEAYYAERRKDIHKKLRQRKACHSPNIVIRNKCTNNV